MMKTKEHYEELSDVDTHTHTQKNPHKNQLMVRKQAHTLTHKSYDLQ